MQHRETPLGKQAPMPPLPPGATAHPTRTGPRPLPLHLLGQASTLMISRAALPHLKNGSLPWKPSLAAEAEALRASFAQIDPGPLADAVDHEIRCRMEAFLVGIETYRNHPYRRPLSDPPEIWRDGATRLLDYAPQSNGPPVLAVPSLINRAYILDLTEQRSLMRDLAARGLRPFLLDWGSPGAAEQDFTLSHYIAGRLDGAIEIMRKVTGRRPVLMGYCMGGVLALAAALRRPGAIAGLVLMATPWDFAADGDSQGRLVRGLQPALEKAIALFGQLPVDLLQTLFASIDPSMIDRKFRAFAELEPNSDKARNFVALEDWLNDGIPLPAEVARECLFGWYGKNETTHGQWHVAGQAMRPEALTDVPVLCLVPDRDRIVPPKSALALAARLPRCTTQIVRAGHVGMIVGTHAKSKVYGPIAKWISKTPDPWQPRPVEPHTPF